MPDRLPMSTTPRSARGVAHERAVDLVRQSPAIWHGLAESRGLADSPSSAFARSTVPLSATGREVGRLEQVVMDAPRPVRVVVPAVPSGVGDVACGGIPAKIAQAVVPRVAICMASMRARWTRAYVSLKYQRVDVSPDGLVAPSPEAHVGVAESANRLPQVATGNAELPAVGPEDGPGNGPHPPSVTDLVEALEARDWPPALGQIAHIPSLVGVGG